MTDGRPSDFDAPLSEPTPTAGTRKARREMTALEIAINYIGRGWNPLPLPFRSKRPEGNAWQTRIIDAAAAPGHFNGGPSNIGVILGPSSRGLTDIDLDCREAIAIAPFILPRTGAIFGRASKRASHWLYYTDLSVTTEAAAQRFIDPKNKQTLIELRIGGDKGAQTVFPGSVHEGGEPITWEEDGEPADAEGLEPTVRKLAACSLLARYWPPGRSSRHDLALATGGFLARAGLPPTQVKLAVEAIARAAGDEEWRDRRQAAEDAATAFAQGKHARGYPSLRESFGAEVADKVAEWLGYREQTAQAAEDSSSKQSATLTSTRAAAVEMTSIDWLWPDRFALGKAGLIVGLPDEGKGQLLCYMAAQVTTGGEWPCNEGQAPQGNVILLTAEDDLNDTVVPRLAAAGADLNRVEIVKMVRTGDGERMFSLITDLGLLRQKIVEVGEVRMVQIDPITAYLGVGKIDSFRSTDVRAVLAPLVDLAAELKLSVIGIMHFNKKVDVTNALLRIQDSLAFGAVARHVYGAIDDGEHERKLFVRAKNNIAANSRNKTLAYRFGAKEVGKDRLTSKTIWAPLIVWEAQHVDVTATEAMQATTKTPAARDDAKKFLREILAGGPVLRTEIDEAAEANGVAERTLFRAKADLKIEARKDGDNGKWTWRLPDNPTSWWNE